MLTIKPWPDPIIDVIGHDPRSLYVERFWLPTLGPTSLLLLRHLATQFDRHPEGVHVRVGSTSRALGVGRGEGTSPIIRSLTRLANFDLACDDGRGTVAVRRHVPPAQPRHLQRLPAELRAEHETWADTRREETPLDDARRRARRVAFTLLEQGDEPDRVERVLFATGFHPAICADATRWATERQREISDRIGDADSAA